MRVARKDGKMANLSDASGEAFVTAPTKEDCNRILQIFDSCLGEGEYFTDFDIKKRIPNDEEFLIEFDESKICYEELEEGVRASCNFSGCGRWDYSSNVERSPYWIKTSKSIKDEDLKYLESLSWSAFYDFVDYEPGCEVLGRYSCEIKHEAGTKIENSKFAGYDCDDYGFTWFNIMSLQGYSVEELLDDRCAWSVLDGDNDIDFIKADMNQFIEDYSCHHGISLAMAKNQLSKESETFSKLLALSGSN